MPAASDIHDRADCERLVRAFYGRAMVDPIIGWIFVDVAKLDLAAHVPQIAAFWETVLLGARSYGGGAFRPHALLNARVRLRAGHFERWLWLWRATVDDLFAGERAELAKAHAERVARAFQERLQVIVLDRDGPSTSLDRDGPAKSLDRDSPAKSLDRDGQSTTLDRPAAGGGLVVTHHGAARSGTSDLLRFSA
jgi:hemoglobin